MVQELPPVIASNYKAIGKNTLIGSVDLTVPRWKFRFRGCLWHRKGDKEWINFPSREWVGQDGAKQYAVLNEFIDRDAHERFQSAALAAVRAVASRDERQ